MKRSWSICLAMVCLVLAVLTATAVCAAEAIRVDTSLEITAPQPGDMAQGDGQWFLLREEEQYTVSGLWQLYDYETTAYAPFTGPFQQGQIYALELKAQPREGYELDSFSASLQGTYISWTEEEGIYSCCVPFSLATELTEIEVGPLPEAVIGAEAAVPVIEVPENACYSVQGCFLDRSGLPFTGIFQDGELYYFTATFRPMAGYAFAPQVMLYGAGAGQSLTAEPDQFCVTTAFSFRPEIDTIVIEGVQNAAVGELATVEGIHVPEDAPYNIKNVSWMDENWNSVDGAFQEGHKYRLRFTVTLTDEYAFAKNTTVTVNGQTVPYAYVGDNRAEFELSYSFQSTVEAITITGVQNAAVGEPATVEGITVSDGSVILSAQWLNQDGTEFTGIFEDGKKYTLSIRLAPAEGAAYADNATVTVNGEKPLKWTVFDDSAQVEWQVSFVDTIDTITVENFRLPQIGDEVNTALLKAPDDALYRLQYAVWIDTATGLALEEGETFRLGKAYCLELVVVPLAGCEFQPGALVDLQGLAPQTSMVTPGYAYINVDCSFLIPVDEVILSELQLPVEGHAIRPDAVAIPEDAPYRVLSLQWIDGDTDEPLPDGAIFEAGRLYYCRITLQADQEHTLQEDLMLTFNGTRDPSWPQWSFDAETGALTLQYGRVQAVTPGPNPPTGDTGIALVWALALCSLVSLALLLRRKPNH